VTRPDPLVRLARFVGDFGSSFYDEERQRDVWNEASAFGLQLALWTTMLSATLTIWIVGAPAVPHVVVPLFLLGAVCVLTIGYAQRLGVTVTDPGRRLRMLPYGLLVLALCAGLLRAASLRETLSASFAVGLASGTGVALLALIVLALISRRRSRT